MLSKKEKEIAKIFNKRQLDDDDFICFMITLRKYNACEEMIEWLEKNKQAEKDDIIEKIMEIIQR